jgi:hypothetical protein
MTDTLPLNAQVTRLQESLQRGQPLETRRSQVLGQLLFCEGCCCGRVDRGFPPLPKERLKTLWKERGLNKTIQLTISGCLGPCDLANVACILKADGTAIWLGGLLEESVYDQLIDWAEQCRAANSLLPLAQSLEIHRFSRFEGPGTTPAACQLSVAAVEA